MRIQHDNYDFIRHNKKPINKSLKKNYFPIFHTLNCCQNSNLAWYIIQCIAEFSYNIILGTWWLFFTLKQQ